MIKPLPSNINQTSQWGFFFFFWFLVQINGILWPHILNWSAKRTIFFFAKRLPKGPIKDI